jgi:hypothetical protein
MRGSDHQLVSLFLPPASLRSGRNRIELFEVTAAGRLLQIDGAQ